MHLQKLDIATVTNNRSCDQTEIGIKSVVFKQVSNFANVNSEPPERTLEDYEEDGQAFQLGRITTFQTRYSFFKLQVRPINSTDDTPFTDITGGSIFAVKGNNPQPQYNTIRITHPHGQYEFRLVPQSGTLADGIFIDTTANSQPVHLLDGANREQIDGEFQVSYTGRRRKITNTKATNTEFLFTRATEDVTVTGRVLDLNKYTLGELPPGAGWQFTGDSRADYDEKTGVLRYGVFVNVDNPTAPGAVYARWDGRAVELGAEYQYDNAPSDIVATLPAKSAFSVVEPAAFVRQGSSPHYYVEVNGAGELVAAAFNGNPVTAQTQDPTLEDDFTKLYRVGSDGRGDTYQVPSGANNGPEGPQYDPNTQGILVFGRGE